MRSKLQYLYSILVLTGVLASAYWMVDKQPAVRSAARAQSNFQYGTEPSLSASGLDQLIRFESQFRAVEGQSSLKSERQLNGSKKKRPPFTEPLLHSTEK